MPGYFPKGGGWPAIAKTTPGVIRGTMHKNLDQYVPSMNGVILSQLQALQFKDDGELYVLLLGLCSVFSLHSSLIRMYYRLFRLCILGCGTQRQLRHGWLTARTR